jgi:AcrR family transcriptional regulator
VSAISYHFGSREGLLLAVLARRGGPIDEERGRRRDAIDGSPSTRQLAACLVEPYCDLLAGAPGRSYLRIVAQLRGRFASWRVESDAATTSSLARILDELESRPGRPAPIRRERVVAMIMVMTATTAERARCVDEGVRLELDHADFVANLIDMCSSLIDG